LYAGIEYRTLDGVSSTSLLEGCQRSYLPLPPGGWQVAERNYDSLAVVALYPWGTHCMHLARGESVRTAANAPGDPGSDCGSSAYYLQGTRAASAYPASFRSHSLLLKQGLVSYKPSACNRRILLSRPRPASAAAGGYRRVSRWSLHRRNFDHVTYFEVREPVVLTGFSHPAANPKVLRVTYLWLESSGGCVR
jgi:hypothetical protein